MISLFYQAAQAIAGVFLFTLGLVQKNSPSVLLYTLPSILVKTNKNALFWGGFKQIAKTFCYLERIFFMLSTIYVYYYCSLWSVVCCPLLQENFQTCMWWVIWFKIKVLFSCEITFHRKKNFCWLHTIWHKNYDYCLDQGKKYIIMHVLIIITSLCQETVFMVLHRCVQL